MAHVRELSALLVEREDDDTIVAAIGAVDKASIGRDVDVGTAIPA